MGSPLFLTDLLTGHEPGSAGIPAGEITSCAGKDAGAPRFMGRVVLINYD
jgi:hypothetical protein